MQVICYKNLRRGDWSIAENRNGNRGPLLAHASEVVLANVRFRVSEKRRQAVIRAKTREVHAWAIGELVDHCPADLPSSAITYNPYRAPNFVQRSSGAPVTRCDFVRFTCSDGAIAVGAIDHE